MQGLWAPFPGLSILDFSNNSIGGQLPAEWAFGFNDLEVLNMSWTTVTGSIPAGQP